MQNSLIDTKSVYVRLVIEKILSSNLLNFFSEEEEKKLRSTFISTAPGSQAHCFYLELNSKQNIGHKSTIAVLNFAWNQVKDYEQDKEGNLWLVYRWCLSISVRERYNLAGPCAAEWLNCLSALAAVLHEIDTLKIPVVLKEFFCNSEQRILLEKEKSYLSTCSLLSNLLESHEGKKHRIHLRKGGSPRKIPASFFSIDGTPIVLEEKKYNLKVQESKTYYYKKYRNYELYVNLNNDEFYLYRIS